MKLVRQVMGALGLLASILALSSIIYGASEGQLAPYMQSYMGAAMETYRTMRDAIFGAAGWAIAGFINWCRQWLNWLPAAPWIRVPPMLRDLITLYGLIGSGLHQVRMKARWADVIRMEHAHIFRDGVSAFFLYLTLFRVWVVSVLFWPIKILQYLLLDHERFYKHTEPWLRKRGVQGSDTYSYYREGAFGIFRDWFFFVCAILLGAALFFFLVYAENQIGF